MNIFYNWEITIYNLIELAILKRLVSLTRAYDILRFYDFKINTAYTVNYFCVTIVGNGESYLQNPPSRIQTFLK